MGCLHGCLRHFKGLLCSLLQYVFPLFLFFFPSRNFIANKFQDEKWQAHMAASVTAGACSTSVTNPIWVIKTRLMSQISASAGEGHRTPWHYDNSLDAARQMYRNEGIRAFYSGLAPALLGLTHVAIQFPLYEYLKFRFTGLEMGEQTEMTPQNNIGILAATFLSKMAATTATYPHEVLRTRLQTQQRGTASSDGMINKPRYQGVLMMCRLIVREEGWRAFYNGLGTNMLRAIPAAMTTMFTYETLKSQLIKLQKEAGVEQPRREKKNNEEAAQVNEQR